MGLDFLRNNGGRRVRNYDAQPFLLDDGITQDDEPDETIGWGVELAPDDWRPLDIKPARIPNAWPFRPVRYVDGKDVGRTVAWLQSAEGYPVPVRLSEIGAVVMRDVNGELRREYDRVERVVSLMVDLFPWEEVESFARALQANGYRLLACSKPEAGWSFDFERMRQATQHRSNDEMVLLEKQGVSRGREAPTIVDGRLEPRTNIVADNASPVIGVIKTHSRNYLHPQGWRAFYDLQPGERTPAFRLEGRTFPIISWFLRLDGAGGELPNWGVVRLEMPDRFFGDQLARDWAEVDRLSRLVFERRCRDQRYGRQAVSLHPIQRAEESLGSLFTEADALINRFYRLTSL